MDELNNNIMEEVMKRLGAMASPAGECCKEDAAPAAPSCNLTEFVGTAMGHTIGLVIANVDHQVHEALKIEDRKSTRLNSSH